ncbi:hypothetical protein [Paenibacillus ferrarius]|uniref:hypothetical protein n=1 Tax=Paenibacillus ferrarius TaxID=1469647 RepID=UPI001301E438|nr:hypothetical protein [Paenibacillus ferrarius]
MEKIMCIGNNEKDISTQPKFLITNIQSGSESISYNAQNVFNYLNLFLPSK